MLSKSPKRKVISYFPSGSSFSDKISPPRELFALKGRVTLSFISPKSVFERVTTEGFFVSLSQRWDVISFDAVALSASSTLMAGEMPKEASKSLKKLLISTVRSVA